jgi:hypothetical protein
LPIENHYVDLFAEDALAVDDVRPSRLISSWQISSQQFKPVSLSTEGDVLSAFSDHGI